jgi:N-acetylglucosamine-6-sulfatase
MPNVDRSRRKVLELCLQLAAGVSLASALSSCGFTAPKPSVKPPPPGPRYQGERPNVVVVLLDDLAAEVMGTHSRFPFLETPNVTRLQREGATFEQAFVPTAVCSPSRASLLTGTYAHTHGVRVNDIQDLEGDLPNFPALLKEAGYDTGFVGKWHMDNASSEPRLDFDYWLSFKGQGVYQDPVLNENGREFRARGYVTDLLGEYAVDYIQTPREKPFCLIVSHKAGHVPFRAAPRHETAFTGAQLPEPENFRETFAGKPEWQRRYKLCGLQRETWEACEGVEIPESLPLEPWNPNDDDLLTHLRTLLAVDEGVGLLLEALDNMDQLDNTVIVFTSDNGFMLGAHRLFDKRVMYEESLRVPLIVRYPKGVEAGRRIPQLVSTLDLAPTLVELGGLEPTPTMTGASLLPLFKDAAAPWRDHFLYEYFQERNRGPGVPTMLGVRTERWKYVHYPELPDDIDELYDLENDPHELLNLIADPEYAATLGELQGALQQQLADTGYPGQLAGL